MPNESKQDIIKVGAFLGSPIEAANSLIEFDYQIGLDGKPMPVAAFGAIFRARSRPSALGAGASL